MSSAIDLFSTYAGRKPDLEPWLRDASKMPEDLFTGSNETKQALFAAIRRAQGR